MENDPYKAEGNVVYLIDDEQDEAVWAFLACCVSRVVARKLAAMLNQAAKGDVELPISGLDV